MFDRYIRLDYGYNEDFLLAVIKLTEDEPPEDAIEMIKALLFYVMGHPPSNAEDRDYFNRAVKKLGLEP